MIRCFCTHCGSKTETVDTPKAQQCHVCGFVQVENDCKYCANCGVRLDGKNECMNCSHEFIGTYCTKCGNLGRFSQNRPIHVHVTPQPTVRPQRYAPPPNPIQKKMLSKLSAGIALLASVIALIFCFFTSYSINMDTALKETLSVTDTNYSVFYFFSDVYSDAQRHLSEMVYYTGYCETLYYLTCIFGTIICALNILLPAVFTLLATINVVRFVLGKTEKSPLTFCVYAVLSYVAGTAMFATLNCGTFSVSAANMTFEGSITLNATAIVGIALSLTLLVTAVVFNLISKPEGFYTKKRTILLISSAVKTALLIVACVFTVVTTNLVANQSGMVANTHLNAVQYMPTLAQLFAEHSFYEKHVLIATEAFVYCLLSYVLNLASLLLIYNSLASVVANPDKPHTNGKLIPDIVSVVIAISGMIFHLVFASTFVQLPLPYTSANLYSAPVIVYAVLTLLALALSVATKIINSKITDKKETL